MGLLRMEKLPGLVGAPPEVEWVDVRRGGAACGGGVRTDCDGVPLSLLPRPPISVLFLPSDPGCVKIPLLTAQDYCTVELLNDTSGYVPLRAPSTGKTIEKDAT
eukprot:m.136711 g.136711  ORF g.136711 m.136711 type:complete len:104 (-) comp17580_c0_seq4:54-365(-)